MKGQRILIGVLALGLLLALAVGLSLAQGPEPPEGEVGAEGKAGIQATVGNRIPIQGRLTDASGSPLDGNYSVTFRLYNVSSGGTALCSDTNNVLVTNGLFTSEIWGTCTPDKINGQSLYLGIQVEGDPEMTPRKAIYPVPYAWSLRPGARIEGTSDGSILTVQNSGNGQGIYGYTQHGYAGVEGTSADWYGVWGQGHFGVFGLTFDSSNARGVYGRAGSDTGATYGVYGRAQSPDGYGGYFENVASSGDAHGVYGKSASSSGRGVYGAATATSGATVGVWGETNSSSDWADGVFGKATAESGVTTGVYGWNASTGGRGVMGAAKATSGETYGVKGESNSPDGYGGYFENQATGGVAYGVYGKSNSSTGVYGKGPHTGVRGYASASSGPTYGIAGTSYSTSGYGVSGLALSTSGPTRGVYGESRSPNSHAGHFFNTSSGVALYARTDSGTGNIIEAWSSDADREFRVERDGDVYADGNFHSGGADLAEMLPAVGGLEAGDVLAVDPDGKLIRSTAAYQPTVVGVYSTAPGFVGGSGDDVDLTDKIPLAVVGVAPVKASAENGSIQPGDLLVASTTPGHAMKASPNPPIGTVIGKALEGLDEGTGVIRILVMLQ